MITLAQEAAKQAGEVLRGQFGRASLGVESKGPGDYVTEADRRAEDAIRELLETEAPEHGWVFEESGARAGTSDYTWVVDALDGTTNFIHRYPFFAVSIALLHRGRSVLGVVFDPMRGEMFTAEDGDATRLNGIATSVSPRDELGEALLGTGFPLRSPDLLSRYLEAFEALFLRSAGMRRGGAAALDLAYVAAGRLDGFWELGLAPWDTAAGEVLVRSAGGQVSDLGGDAPSSPSTPETAGSSVDIVASNGRIHDKILEVTRRVFRQRIAERKTEQNAGQSSP